MHHRHPFKSQPSLYHTPDTGQARVYHPFNMLAAEGFLPGYGLEVGSVVGWADIPFWQTGAMDFALPRPPATALREYVQGSHG